MTGRRSKRCQTVLEREAQRVIDGAIANLKQYYVYPEIGQKMADALLAHEKSGDDDAMTDGGAFADLLTRQMTDVSNDRQLMVVYHRVETPDRPPGPTPETLARYRKALEQNNCFFEKTEILAHNIGYLKINSFPDPSLCEPTAAAAMASTRNGWRRLSRESFIPAPWVWKFETWESSSIRTA